MDAAVKWKFSQTWMTFSQEEQRTALTAFLCGKDVVALFSTGFSNSLVEDHATMGLAIGQ